MGATPKYALRYPEPADPADVPTDMHELATDVEAALQSKGPGAELAYTQITASVNITGTTEAGATAIISSGAFAVDGSTPILIEFYTQAALTPAGQSLILWLLGPGGSLGRLAFIPAATGLTEGGPVRVARRLTPAAGNPNYTISGQVSAGTGVVSAGPGGAGNDGPAFIRVIRAA